MSSKPAAPAGRDGGLKVRVRTARKRSHASTLWLARQLNDPYVARAKREGFRSRAAYKLLEMDERFGLFRKGRKIVDLGAAPGGWSQVAGAAIGAAAGNGRLVAVDLIDMEPIPGVRFARLDFTEADAPERIKDMLAASADGVMSDMAANATGHRKTDHLRIVALAELAADFAREILAPGGFLLAKVLQGGSEAGLLSALKRDFTQVRHVKPAASRSDSAELYVLATGFRARTLRPDVGSADEPDGGAAG